MTFGKLKEKLRALLNERDEATFEEEYGQRLVECANSGLLDLATTAFPKRRTVKINHRRLPNTASITRFKKGKESVLVTAPEGEGLSFYCDGNGRAEIFTGGEKEGEIELISSSEPIFYSYLIKGKGEVKILFSGAFAFSVYDLGVFPYLYKAGEVPPASEKREYFLEDLVPDFMALDNVHPILCEKELSETENYCILSEKSIVFFKEGLYSVPYFAYPDLLTPFTADTDEIDLPEKGCRLLCLYMAAELYADYDFEQARSFKNDYLQGKSESFSESDLRGQWKITTGWLR